MPESLRSLTDAAASISEPGHESMARAWGLLANSLTGDDLKVALLLGIRVAVRKTIFDSFVPQDKPLSPFLGRRLIDSIT